MWWSLPFPRLLFWQPATKQIQQNQFWAKEAIERLSWIRPFDSVKSGTLQEGNMAWFTGGQLNACYQCCDRHDPSKIAIIWEGNEVDEARTITYGEMTKRVCQYANVLKSKGVKKGDRVLFTSYAGTEVEWEGTTYLIMSETDILGVIR